MDFSFTEEQRMMGTSQMQRNFVAGLMGLKV